LIETLQHPDIVGPAGDRRGEAFSVRMQAEAGNLADVRGQVERGKPLFSARLDVD
jgi:hypothetical protein